jgi:hypothetical protein
MNELNCSKHFHIEYELRQKNPSGKLCYPKPARFICRIREFLTFNKRPRSNGTRRQKPSKGVNKSKQHVRRRFPANKVIVNGEDDTWQTDLEEDNIFIMILSTIVFIIIIIVITDQLNVSQVI